MRFWVRVPVLSEQMTVTEPSVSTAGSLRISALRRSMRWAPIARVKVTTAGNPSGITATATLIAVSRRSDNASPPSAPMATTSAATATPAERELLAHPVEALLQRRPAGAHPLQQGGDATEFGAHPGGHDHAPAAAVGDLGTRVGHVGAVAERAGRRRRRAASICLVDRFGLAGERRLLDPQPGRLDQPKIGGHDVAGLEQHHVAGHQLDRGDLDHPAIAVRPDRRHGEPAQRGDGPLGPVLLDEPEQREQHHDRADRSRFEDTSPTPATTPPHR